MTRAKQIPWLCNARDSRIPSILAFLYEWCCDIDFVGDRSSCAVHAAMISRWGVLNAMQVTHSRKWISFEPAFGWFVVILWTTWRHSVQMCVLVLIAAGKDVQMGKSSRLAAGCNVFFVIFKCSLAYVSAGDNVTAAITRWPCVYCRSHMLRRIEYMICYARITPPARIEAHSPAIGRRQSPVVEPTKWVFEKTGFCASRPNCTRSPSGSSPTHLFCFQTNGARLGFEYTYIYIEYTNRPVHFWRLTMIDNDICAHADTIKRGGGRRLTFALCALRIASDLGRLDGLFRYTFECTSVAAVALFVSHYVSQSVSRNVSNVTRIN